MFNGLFIEFDKYAIIKIDLSIINKKDSLPLSLLINQENIEKIGCNTYNKMNIAQLIIYIKVYQKITSNAVNYIEQANALVEIFNKKGYKSEIIDKLPKKLESIPI